MKAVRYLKALADETRLRVFSVLLEHELNVNEIVRVLNMGQSRVSRHLRILSDSGLISARRDGLWAFYSAREDEEARGLIHAVRGLNGTERQVAEDLRRAAEVLAERRVQTQAFFESVAGHWDDLKGHLLSGFDLDARIAERLNEDGTIVDVGCGTGGLFDAVGGDAGTLIGVDPSPRMLELARRRFAADGKIQWRLGEAEHLPLGDGEADAAVMSMVLHHLSDPEQGLCEIARVLKGGGLLVLADLAKHDQEALREGHGDRWLGFESTQILHWISRSGFELQEQTRHDLEPPLAVMIYTARKGGRTDRWTKVTHTKFET